MPTPCSHHRFGSSGRTSSHFYLGFAIIVSMSFSVFTVGVSAQFLAPPPQQSVVMVKDAMNRAHIVLFDQFAFSPPHFPNCGVDHYHAKFMDRVIALDGTVIPDPATSGCGYGKASQIKAYREFKHFIGDDDHDGIPNTFEVPASNKDNPDANNNGIPDGQEDPDGDGLRSAYELLVSKTDPNVRNTGGSPTSDGTRAVLAKNRRNFTNVPLLVNLYQNSGADAAHIKEAVKVANKILKLVDVRITVRGIKTAQSAGDTGAGGGTANDGKFTEEEIKLVQIAGAVELQQGPTPGGMKLSTSQQLQLAQVTPGASGHRYPVVVCQQRGSTELTGTTLAHEILHAMTLAGHPAPGTPERTPGNIMTPSDSGRDEFVLSPDADKGCENLTLTKDQIATVKKDKIAQLFGRPSSRRSPAQKDEYAKAFASDATTDQTGGAPDWLDLDMVAGSTTETLEGDDVLHLLITVNDRFPVSGDFQAVFEVGFDTDANTATGSTSNGLQGVDRRIQAYVRRLEGATEIYTAAEMHSSSTFDEPIAPVPSHWPVERMAGSSLVPNLHRDEAVELFLVQDDLDFTANLIPMVVSAHVTDFAAAVDVVNLTLDRKAWENDPTLTVPVEFAEAGDLLTFTVEGLTPNDPYELMLDDTLVVAGLLDATGSASDQFVLDSLLVPDFYFLTASDTAGLFAGSGVEIHDPIFQNGFETGDTTEWSTSTP